MYFQNLHESKMAANNLNNYQFFQILNPVEAIMKSLLNLFCTRQSWPLLEPHEAFQRASRDADELFWLLV